jgi:DNA-binding IclR family transcriptional regulator
MAHTYEELSKLTVADLRDIAKDLDHEAVQGATQMNKEHLLPALCKALGIETHAHHVVVGIDKPAIKAKIRQLKSQRGEAIKTKDHAKLRRVRRRVHRLKRRIRQHLV